MPLQLRLQLQKFGHHALVFSALCLQNFHLLLFVAAEQADTVDALRENQKQERNEDKSDISGGGFQEQEKRAEHWKSTDIFSDYDGSHGAVIDVRGSTVGDEGKGAVLVDNNTADLMGDSLAVAVGILGNESDDVTRSQCCDVYALGDDDVAYVKVCRRHGVGLYNEELEAKETTVVAVKGVDRDQREYHHKDSNGNQKPNEDCL